MCNASHVCLWNGEKDVDSNSPLNRNSSDKKWISILSPVKVESSKFFSNILLPRTKYFTVKSTNIYFDLSDEYSRQTDSANFAAVSVL